MNTTNSEGRQFYSQFENKNTSPEIKGNESVTLQMPLLSGLMNCGKYLPLRFLQGLSIELVLVSHHKDAALMTQDFYGATTLTEPEWTITEPVIKCQVVTIDNELENGFVQRLLDGKSMPFHYTSFITQVANAGNTPNPSVSITRAFTRLKAAYISLFKRTYIHNPFGTTLEEKYRGEECEHLGNVKEATMFYHPQYLYNGSTREAEDGTRKPFNVDADPIYKAPPDTPSSLGHPHYTGY